MKTKTDLRAGMSYAECDAQKNYYKNLVQTGYCSGGGYPGPVYPPSGGSQTSGQCPSNWAYGTVQQATGGGYYGAIMGQDGLIHYFNNGYTKFFPSGQGVSTGQYVSYAPFPPGNQRAGKAACISSGGPYLY
jgi:hypothetical protein